MGPLIVGRISIPDLSRAGFDTWPTYQSLLPRAIPISRSHERLPYSSCVALADLFNSTTVIAFLMRLTRITIEFLEPQRMMWYNV